MQYDPVATGGRSRGLKVLLLRSEKCCPVKVFPRNPKNLNIYDRNTQGKEIRKERKPPAVTPKEKRWRNDTLSQCTDTYDHYNNKIEAFYNNLPGWAPLCLTVPRDLFTYYYHYCERRPNRLSCPCPRALPLWPDVKMRGLVCVTAGYERSQDKKDKRRAGWPRQQRGRSSDVSYLAATCKSVSAPAPD